MKMIPDEIKATYCYGEDRHTVTDCQWYVLPDCPETCRYAINLKKGISIFTRTGLERFIERFGLNWQTKKDNSEDLKKLNNLYCNPTHWDSDEK